MSTPKPLGLPGLARIALLLVAMLAWAPAMAQQAAAEVTMLVGRGTAVAPDGNIRALDKDGAVYAGEIVTTGTNSFLNLRFRDGGLVTLRPNSRFEVREFEYRGTAPAADVTTAAASPPPPDGGFGRAVFRLLRGGFRTVTGLIGKDDRDAYEVTTPVATIGIRGTDYLAVLCELACQTDPVVGAGLPDGASADGASVFGVIEGRILLVTPQGESRELGADEYALVLADGRIVLLGEQPRFLRIDPIPNPQSCVE